MDEFDCALSTSKLLFRELSTDQFAKSAIDLLAHDLLAHDLNVSNFKVLLACSQAHMLIFAHSSHVIQRDRVLIEHVTTDY